MLRVELLDRVLRAIAAQDPLPAAQMARDERFRSGDTFAASIADFCEFMGSRPVADHPLPAHASDPIATTTRLAVLALGGSCRTGPGHDLPDLVTRLSAIPTPPGDGRVPAFCQHLVAEAALACGRVDLAQQVLALLPTPESTWAGHPYAPVMAVCRARTAVYSTAPPQALAAIAPVRRPTGTSTVGLLLDAAYALVGGTGANVAMTGRRLNRIEAAHRTPPDRLGHQVRLLAAQGAAALGDSRRAAALLGDPPCRDADAIPLSDRAQALELLVRSAIAEGNLDAAQLWVRRGADWNEHRATLPALNRTRARIALLAGDPARALQLAESAATEARDGGRLLEVVEAEVLAARAHLALGQDSAAVRLLRRTVLASDRRGLFAVRQAAVELLRPTKRRLPPRPGGGWSVLSPSERRVAELILTGADNAAIAHSLALAPSTVRTHVSRVLIAFEVTTRTGLLALRQTAPTDTDDNYRPGLTRRQCEVARLLAHGESNRQIAAQLEISVHSVESHVSAILLRWQLRSRFEIAHRWWSPAPTPPT